MNYNSPMYLPLYNAFTEFVPSIPKMYWDTYSQEQRIKAICEAIDKIIAYANDMGIQLNRDTEDIEKLVKEFETFKESGFDDYYREIINKWVDDNMVDIMSQAMKNIFFGLDDEGYLVVSIPDSWSSVEFDTGMIYDSKEYGRLIMKY